LCVFLGIKEELVAFDTSVKVNSAMSMSVEFTMHLFIWMTKIETGRENRINCTVCGPSHADTN